MLLVLNMSRGDMSDFGSFQLLRFTLVIKLRNFDLIGSLKYFNIFSKKMITDLIITCQTVSDLA